MRVNTLPPVQTREVPTIARDLARTSKLAHSQANQTNFEGILRTETAPASVGPPWKVVVT